MKNILCLVTAVFFMLMTAFPARAEKIKECSVVFELTSGVIIDSSGENDVVSIGTMNKLMTVLLAAEKIESGKLSLNTIVKASENANSMQGAQIWLMPGESISVEELLKGIIIGNANDASVAIAEAVSGSEQKFVVRMNERAAELGMFDTSFTNCCGYYDDNKQLSTAADLSKLICELYKHEFLKPYFTTWLDYVRDGAAELVNSNVLVKNFDGIIGFKAGFTENAGNFTAAAAKRDDKAFGVIILGAQDKDEMFLRAKNKLNSVFADYIVIKPDLPEKIPICAAVRGALTDEVPIKVGSVRNIVIPKGAADSITSKAILPDYVYAPVNEDDKIGEIAFYRKDKYLFSVDITASESVKEKTVGDVLTKLLKFMFSF